jgi:hypothetical protein
MEGNWLLCKINWKSSQKSSPDGLAMAELLEIGCVENESVLKWMEFSRKSEAICPEIAQKKRRRDHSISPL